MGKFPLVFVATLAACSLSTLDPAVPAVEATSLSSTVTAPRVCSYTSREFIPYPTTKREQLLRALRILSLSGHSLDQGTSASSTWQNAVSSSSCVPDPYADTSYAEDFAQNNVLYTYKLHIGAIPADTTCLNPQLNVFANTPRLATTQTTSTCFPDKRPFTLCVQYFLFMCDTKCHTHT